MADSDRPARRRSSAAIAPRRPQPLPHPRRRTRVPIAPPRTRSRQPPGGLVALPWPVRGLLLAALLGLGALAIILGGGTLGRATAGVTGAIGHAFGGLIPVAGPTASATRVPIGAPRLEPPVAAFTQQPSVDVQGHLPAGVAGTDDHIDIYVGGTIKATQPVPTTSDFTVTDVALVAGLNTITATIATDDGESEPSVPISITFDADPPPLAISSPKNGATVLTATVVVKGTTQGAATVTIHNATNGGSATAVATASGAFSTTVTLAEGSNALNLTAVDPAGNRTTKTLTVVRGSGVLTAKVSLSWYTRSNSKLPYALNVTVVVDDVTGHPIADPATASFTVGPPGEGTIVSGDPPAALVKGTASWSVDIVPQNTGSGLVTVVVTLADGRTVSASRAFTITK